MLERIVRKRVGHMEERKSILSLFLQRFTYHSEEQWRQYFNEGRILINQKTAMPETILKQDDIIEYHPPELPEPEVNSQFSVIYEDKALMVINKPANLPCHPSGKFFRHTLWGVLKEQFDLDQVRIIHRLDRETSGIVIVAKTEDAARSCQQQFAHRTTEKRYLTIVEGLFPDELTMNGFLTADIHSSIRKKRCFIPSEQAIDLPKKDCETSETFFRCLAQKQGLSLVEAFPKTGRLHQIRATLRSFNFPIVGDKLYGLDELIYLRFINEQLTLKDHTLLRWEHQALHAQALTIYHPMTNEKMIFETPFPEEFRKLF